MHCIKRKREKGDFGLQQIWEGSRGRLIYIRERGRRRRGFCDCQKGRERSFQGKMKEARKRPVGKIWEYKKQWRFSHRKEVFPGMFTIDPFLIPIILLMYEFSLNFESRSDARG